MTDEKPHPGRWILEYRMIPSELMPPIKHDSFQAIQDYILLLEAERAKTKEKMKAAAKAFSPREIAWDFESIFEDWYEREGKDL